MEFVRHSPEPAVSIHASAWEATAATSTFRRRRGRFNPRLRMGGDKSPRIPTKASTGFNPRLRMGGDSKSSRGMRASLVSIHASAWEATRIRAIRGSTTMFQSTPPHGRRLLQVADERDVVGFNPRLRMGGDLAGFVRLLVVRLFQSTPPHGRRPAQAQTDVMAPLFQSTPPHGRRLAGHLLEIPDLLFQSTPPHGRRRPCPAFGAPLQFEVSIHASAWEATSTSARFFRLSSFNPRLRMGGDHRKRPTNDPIISFNPRLRMGGDLQRSKSIGIARRFNPRLRMGGDRQPRPSNATCSRFNPRLRMGGDQAARNV